MHKNIDRKEDWGSEALKLLEECACAEARESFWCYRQFINPDMQIGWWQCEVAVELQRFYLEYKAGLRPMLLFQSPPQHGKSSQIIDFISWVAGHEPNAKVIYASFSDRLGIRANRRLQQIYDSLQYQRIFRTRINSENMITETSRCLRNDEILEYVNAEGYFRNTTVMGAVTGEGLDIGVIDDPIKSRAEASSEVLRNKTWEWLTDDFLTRFSDMGALLMIMTRWHLDDPVGRLIQRCPDLKVVRYPALAVQGEKYRRIGEPLFPELKSLDFLLRQKSLMTESGWESEYQQSPIIVGGGIFPIEKFRTLPVLDRNKITGSCRYWDKAATAGGDGAYTAGVLMHSMSDGTFVVEHVIRGRWSALQREEIIKAMARNDRAKISEPYDIVIEQEPGSGGKESAESTIRMLAGYRVYADRVTGSKEVRAEPYAAQVQAGNVFLIAGDWQYQFLDEHESFPNGKYKDQVDASAGAFARLTQGLQYNLDAMAS
jgi:predicted phage terminase large subunit-like protein